MESRIENLTEIELCVYAEIANASQEGICITPATVLRRKAKLTNYFFNKTLDGLEKKGLISQSKSCGGVPRTIKLVSNR